MAKEQNVRICSYDVIYNKTHKVSSIYKYFQQIAGDDLDAIGLTRQALLEKGIVFVLAKMKSVFYRPVFAYEELKLQSCHRRIKGASFIRDYVLSCNGEVVGEASSYWALIDINTRRLCRPSVIESSLNGALELCSFEIDDRFSFSGDVDTESYSYTVVFSDIDENCHMNNTRYPDICLDALGLISDNEYVSEVRIDYLAEAKQGETLKVEHTKSEIDGSYYFSAQNVSTGVKCFDAIIKLGKF